MQHDATFKRLHQPLQALYRLSTITFKKSRLCCIKKNTIEFSTVTSIKLRRHFLFEPFDGKCVEQKSIDNQFVDANSIIHIVSDFPKPQSLVQSWGTST